MVQRFEEFGEKHRKVLAARREAENQAKSRLKLILPIGIVFELVLAGSLVFFLSKSITERIGLLAKNATRLAKGDVLLPRTEGGDEIAQLDAVFHDMAQALADAARKERAVVDGMPIGFMVLDKQGRIVSVNPRTCLLLGRRAEGLAGQSIQQLFSKSQAAAELPFDKICDRALGRIAEFEFERSDGTTFPGELSLNAIENSELFVCNILDISERHEIERMKQEFVSIVSHDLKTPIMSIQAALHMMANGTLGEVNQRGERVLKASQEDALRLIRLINDLLDVARIEAGRVDLEYSNVELSSILDRAVGAVLGIANEKRIEIVSEPTAIRLRADEERLVQVMVNLLSNSIKYSPPGSTVKITASSNDSFVEVRVTDQGCGIAPEAQRRIFERFELSDSSDRKEKGGTGLGLAICKLIIEAHGGSIGVESEAGKGSSFWITVPNVRSSVPESGGNMARAATEDNTQQSAG